MPFSSVDRKHPLGVGNMNILYVKISRGDFEIFNFQLLKSLRSTGCETPYICWRIFKKMTSESNVRNLEIF